MFDSAPGAVDSYFSRTASSANAPRVELGIKVRNTAPKSEPRAVPTCRLDGVGLASIRRSKEGDRNCQITKAIVGSHSYHISNDEEVNGIVRTIEAIGAFARDHRPGRYEVIEHYPDPLRDSVESSRTWGEVIHHPDGKVAIRITAIPDPTPFVTPFRSFSSRSGQGDWRV
jgi:hypothetical protein